jgi:hypothetical protein
MDSKKVLKEEDMQNVMEIPKVPVKYQASEGTWIQITFTVTPGQYRALRACAEEEHRSVPGFVRQSVIDSLSKTKILSCKKALGFQGTMQRQP